MRSIHYLMDWLLDERIILLSGAVIFALMSVVLIHWKADKEYVIAFFGLSNGLIGALVRGIVTQRGGQAPAPGNGDAQKQ